MTSPKTPSLESMGVIPTIKMCGICGQDNRPCACDFHSSQLQEPDVAGEEKSVKDVEAAEKYAPNRGERPNCSGHARHGFLAGISHARAQMEGSKGEFDSFPEKTFKAAAYRLIGEQAKFCQNGEPIEPGSDIGWSYNHQRMKDCRKGAMWMFDRLTAKPDEGS